MVGCAVRGVYDELCGGKMNMDMAGLTNESEMSLQRMHQRVVRRLLQLLPREYRRFGCGRGYWRMKAFGVTCNILDAWRAERALDKDGYSEAASAWRWAF